VNKTFSLINISNSNFC